MRRTDVRQQGVHMAWSDSLFELVPCVPPPPLPEPIPVPEVSDSGFDDFIAAQNELELRSTLRVR